MLKMARSKRDLRWGVSGVMEDHSEIYRIVQKPSQIHTDTSINNATVELYQVPKKSFRNQSKS
jgi:hypothetical protein